MVKTFNLINYALICQLHEECFIPLYIQAICHRLVLLLHFIYLCLDFSYIQIFKGPFSQQKKFVFHFSSIFTVLSSLYSEDLLRGLFKYHSNEFL